MPVCHCKAENDYCNRKAGTCMSGCKDGWTGMDCNIREYLTFIALNKL